MTKQDKTYIAIAGVTVFGALAGFLIVKKLKKKKEEKEGNPTNGALPPSGNTNNQQGSSSGAANNQTQSPPVEYPEADYAALSKRLEEAFSPNWVQYGGTDEDTIYITLRLLRAGQLQKLIDHWNKTHEKTLQWHLKDELSSGELEIVRKIFTKHDLTI